MAAGQARRDRGSRAGGPAAGERDRLTQRAEALELVAQVKTVALTQLHADGTPDYVRATAGRLLLSCAKMLIAVSEPPDTRSVPAVGVSAEKAMIVDLFNKAGMTGSAAEPSG